MCSRTEVAEAGLQTVFMRSRMTVAVAFCGSLPGPCQTAPRAEIAAAHFAIEVAHIRDGRQCRPTCKYTGPQNANTRDPKMQIHGTQKCKYTGPKNANTRDPKMQTPPLHGLLAGLPGAPR